MVWAAKSAALSWARMLAAVWAVVPVLWLEVESAPALAQYLSCSVPRFRNPWLMPPW